MDFNDKIIRFYKFTYYLSL